MEATVHRERAQPPFLALLASGWSAVYPCHVPPATMRTKPIGTGPFKVVDFSPNEGLTLRKNPDYWEGGQPYLDGNDWNILRSRPPRLLAFVTDDFDFTGPADVSLSSLADLHTPATPAHALLRSNTVLKDCTDPQLQTTVTAR